MCKRAGSLAFLICVILALVACDDDEVVNGDGTAEAEAEVDQKAGAADEDERPYLHDELENAMANLEAPQPGTAVLRFENGDEYLIDKLQCDIDEDDPDKGQIDGMHQLESGENFRVTIRRTGSDDSLENEFTVRVEVSDDEIQHAMFTRTRGNFPIMAEEGADGRSAFVIRDGDTWYAGAPLEPQNALSDPYYDDYGESWMAANCQD